MIASSIFFSSFSAINFPYFNRNSPITCRKYRKKLLVRRFYFEDRLSFALLLPDFGSIVTFDFRHVHRVSTRVRAMLYSHMLQYILRELIRLIKFAMDFQRKAFLGRHGEIEESNDFCVTFTHQLPSGDQKLSDIHRQATSRKK